MIKKIKKKKKIVGFFLSPHLLFLTFNVFGFCFRVLAVILVSDLFYKKKKKKKKRRRREFRRLVFLLRKISNDEGGRSNSKLCRLENKTKQKTIPYTHTVNKASK